MDKHSFNPLKEQTGRIRPCIGMEYFSLRRMMQKYMGKHMNYSPQDQNGKQSRTVADFGLVKWNMFKGLLNIYGSEIKVHSRFGFRRISIQKEQLSLHSLRFKVKIELI